MSSISQIFQLGAEGGSSSSITEPDQLRTNIKTSGIASFDHSISNGHNLWYLNQGRETHHPNSQRPLGFMLRLNPFLPKVRHQQRKCKAPYQSVDPLLNGQVPPYPTQPTLYPGNYPPMPAHKGGSAPSQFFLGPSATPSNMAGTTPSSRPVSSAEGRTDQPQSFPNPI